MTVSNKYTEIKLDIFFYQIGIHLLWILDVRQNGNLNPIKIRNNQIWNMPSRACFEVGKNSRLKFHSPIAMFSRK